MSACSDVPPSFFFKQKTAYDIVSRDWSSDVCSSDPLGALTRMVDMGVEPYLLSSALGGVLAQRLVRQVCPGCKHTYLPSPALVAAHGLSPQAKLTKGRG